MLKRKAWVFMLCGLLCGCGNTAPAEPAASPSASSVESSADSASPADVSAYISAVNDVSGAESWTASVSSDYTMHYEDGSDVFYTLDGLLEAEGVSGDPSAHLHMTIESDTMPAELDSYYYGGRLYSVYNNVEFYEDQSFDSVKSTMLVPLDLVSISKNQISSVSEEKTDEGTQWTVVLNKEGAENIFRNHYDFYGLSGYDDYQVTGGVMTQAFDQENHLISQKSSFQASVSYQGSAVTVDAGTTVQFTDLNQTKVKITDDLKEKQKSYASYQDIDTSTISDADPSEDDAGENAVETFQKRLVYRLGYEKQSDGSYLAQFNDRESYRVDFTNHTFTYTNYTSSYVYNWKGDEGGFGSVCSYSFASGTSTDDCDESVLEQIRNTKNFLLMELYYCGLSLEDLQQAS